MSFSLQNINAPVPPKWKHNDHILKEYKKFRCSCQRIFDGPMAHVTSGKVKTNMFLIWCGPDWEDIMTTLNDEICHAKLDTGAQINVMTESLFKCIEKINKLPLYPMKM